MKKFLLTCSALLFAFTLLAQGQTVSGTVTSEEDGSALPGVNVIVKGTTTGGVTDTEGKYTLLEFLQMPLLSSPLSDSRPPRCLSHQDLL